MSLVIAIMYLTHLITQAGSISRNALVHLSSESLDFENSDSKRNQMWCIRGGGWERRIQRPSDQKTQTSSCKIELKVQQDGCN